jgi:hypothetical protein
MPSYTKLFNSIITSTIWTQDDQTRIVWITMLALCDQHGEVHGSVPGLARLSGVSIDAVELALEKFLSPDPYSRTTDDEGRRIEKIDGGWFLINHAKYRNMASKADEKCSNAKRQQRHRAKVARNATVTDSNATVTDSNGRVTQERDIAEAEAYTDTKKDIKTAPPMALPFDSPDFVLFWSNWEQHRKEKKAKLTPTARNQQLEKLKDMGEHRAVAALKHSLANGWTGIFEPEQAKTNGQHKGIEEIIPLRRL